MGVGRTFFDQAKGGAQESFGLGTIYRGSRVPDASPGDDTPSLMAPFMPSEEDGGPPEVMSGTAAIPEGAKRITEDEYKSSPYFRDDIPWDRGMTDERAAALALMYDQRKVREFYAQKRPVTSFLGNLAGQALDPINYVPIAGPLVKAAAVAKVGRVGGAAVAGALDAAGNTAMFGLLTREARRGLGDDVSWQAMVSEVATAALIGSAFGSVSGVLQVRADAKARLSIQERLSTLRNTQEARVALNEGIDALARGEDVRLSPNATVPAERIAREIAELNRAYEGASPVSVRRVEEFETAKGSVYRVLDDGTTIRDKAARNDPGHEGDSGIKPQTARTVYVDTNAAVLSAAGMQDLGPQGARVVVKDGKATLLTWNDKADRWGAAPSSRDIPVYDEPAIGRYPLELWKKANDVPGYADAYRGMHAGNKITRIKERPAAPPESRPQAGNLAEDTAGDRSIGTPGAGQSVPAPDNVARTPVVDKTEARPDPLPEGRAEAEGRIIKAEDTKALAEQFSVDPATGAFPEETDIAQLRAEGRLTEADIAELADADAAYEDGAAYSEALKSVAGCLI